MKNIIKKICIPMLLGLGVLASCSGSPLSNEKKVEKATFEAAITKTKENTTSNICELRGTNIVNEGNEQKFEYTALLSWDSVKKEWVGPSTSYSLTATHITSAYIDISSLIIELGVADSAQYYTADNGYHFKLDATKESTTSGIKNTVSVDCIWNEFGYPVSEKLSIITEFNGLKNKTITETSYTYRQSN